MERQSDKRGVVNPATPHVELHRSPDASDAVLASRAAGGDHEAFALLYHRNKHDVWRLASFRLGDPHEAEDALQETFLRAYRALADFHGDTARPWLLAICRNVCLDRLRTRRARGFAFLEDEGGAEAVATRTDVDGGLDLRRALAGLPAEDAEAFFFVDVLGLRSHEAASVLGLRASSTLRSRLDRARKELARALAPPPVLPTGRALWGIFHTPPERALVVAHSDHTAADGSVGMSPLGDAGQLVRFFDTLEHQIPAGHRVVAVLGAPPARSVDAAVPWISHHPRWRLRVSSGDSWRRDAETALTDSEDAAALAQLRTDHPFVWTPTR